MTGDTKEDALPSNRGSVDDFIEGPRGLLPTPVFEGWYAVTLDPPERPRKFVDGLTRWADRRGVDIEIHANGCKICVRPTPADLRTEFEKAWPRFMKRHSLAVPSP